MNRRLPEKARSSAAGEAVHLPESPRGPMEFLSRSWSASALLLSKALSTTSAATSSKSPPPSNFISPVSSVPIPGDAAAAAVISEDSAANAFSFSFASSATSQLVLERIMSQSEISPLTSGRLSHSSEPLNGSSITDGTDSPPISPSDEFDDVVKYLRSNNSLQPLFTGAPRNGAGAAVNGSGVNTPGGKTVGRWLKERREKKKEENRAHNAQIHAAVSVASVAASVAAIAAATAAASAAGKDEQMAKNDMAVASAATLVAAQCVEAAETMGATRELLVAAISSAVNVRSHGDISTLTAAAATALRGVVTLKARAVKEVWNAAALVSTEKGSGIRISGSFNHDHHNHHPTAANNCFHGGEGPESEENFLDACNQQLLARGTELLKRTRKGDLHLKIVSVYIHRTGQVMLKMKSKHVAGTITKKKKNVVKEVCKNLPSWPGRHLLEDGEQRRYFGLRTENRGLVEFECKNQREYDIWTHGVSRLLEIIAERNGINGIRCQPTMK